MPQEIWILLLVLTAAIAALAGFAVARRGAPTRSELQALERELGAARQRAAEVQTNVTSHFEQSAVLFGQLARDYRAFLQHFSESARELGISEAAARELLERADRPLLGRASEIIDGETELDRTADADAAAAEAADGSDAPESSPAADPRAAVDAPVAADSPVAADEPVVADIAKEPDAAAAAASRDDEDDAARAATSGPVPESGEGMRAQEPEPPLIDDVVQPGRPGARPQRPDTARETAASRVVDVDLDALGLPIRGDEPFVQDGERDSTAEASRKGSGSSRKRADAS